MVKNCNISPYFNILINVKPRSTLKPNNLNKDSFAFMNATI